MPDSDFCPFCEDEQVHTGHRASDGAPLYKCSSRLNEYDVFYLARPVPGDDSIPVGTRGVVLMVHGGDPCQYEVEFPGESGRNLGRSISYTLGQEFIAVVD